MKRSIQNHHALLASSCAWSIALILASLVAVQLVQRSVDAQDASASTNPQPSASAQDEKEKPKDEKPAAPAIERAWEFDPYRVQVWIAAESSPLLGPTTLTEMTDQVQWMAEQVALSSWIVTATPAPELLDGVAIRRQMLDDLKQVEFAKEREKRLAMAPNADKIILVTVRDRGTDFEILSREYDVTSDMLGPVHRNECGYRHRLGKHCYQAVADSFAPVARIQKSDQRTDERFARLLPRAAGLIPLPTDPNAEWAPPPTFIKDTDVLIPMVRHTGRLQLNRPEVEVKTWTFLRLDHREGDELVCGIESMFRTPLAGRTARRQQRIAMVAKPGYDQTRIALVSTSQDKRALWGYRVFRIDIDPDTGEELPVLVGKTDWKGEIEIDNAAGVYQTLYIKNGERTLGRLPLVVGHMERVEAPVLADDIRLRAEGVIQGLQSQFLDLVARREVITKRARYRIEQGEFDGARELINEIRQLPTTEQFQLTIEQQRRQVLSNDSREQSRIDGMFNRLGELLTKYLNDDIVSTLDGELRAAEEKAGVGATN